MHTSKNLNHLGVLSVVCKEIKVAEDIGRVVGAALRQKVACGQAVVSAVLKFSYWKINIYSRTQILLN